MPNDTKKLILLLPDEALEDLVIIVKNASKLSQISQCISDFLFISNPNKIASIIAKKNILKEDTSSTIITSLIRFSRICRENDLDYKEFIIQLGNKFIEFVENKKKEIENPSLIWEKSKIEIEKALSPNSPFYVLQKSVALAYANRDLLHDICLVTDIRPVFNDKATKIEKMVVTHLLMLEYFNGDTKKQLHLTIDENDIKKIQKLCNRAQQKASLIFNDFKNRDLAVSIIGGKDNE